MKSLIDPERKNRFVLNFIILFIALFTFSKREYSKKEASSFDRFLIDSFAPVQEGVHSLQGSVRDFFNHYIANVSASKEAEKLKSKIEDLERQVFEGEEILRENKRLEALLKFESTLEFSKVLAKVVAWDSNSDLQMIRINKGKKAGLRIQSPVVTSKGLVGYVYRLTGHYADILTVRDPSNRVDGIIQRVRSHGIIEGDTSSKLVMKYVSRTEPVILKDTVITSGLGNIYPKGIRIGSVSRIERESYGITQQVELTPAVSFGSLEEVVVLVKKKNERLKKEWEALDKMEQEKSEERR